MENINHYATQTSNNTTNQPRMKSIDNGAIIKPQFPMFVRNQSTIISGRPKCHTQIVRPNKRSITNLNNIKSVDHSSTPIEIPNEGFTQNFPMPNGGNGNCKCQIFVYIHFQI